MGDKYQALFELGSGAFGQAWVMKEKKGEREVVAKVIKMSKLQPKQIDNCITELSVLSACKHVNIIQYLDAYLSDGNLNIIMEYAKNGDLHDRLEKQKGVPLSKEIISDWFMQLVSALDYIHSRNILHRDLKPRNVFVMDDSTLKLGDFGIARVLCNKEDLASTMIGTPFYLSPEICQGKPYNSSSDMWAAGCVLYEMCCFKVPFEAANLTELYHKIQQAKYKPVHSQFGETIPYLLSNLLVSNPGARLSSREILTSANLKTIKDANIPKQPISQMQTDKSSIQSDASVNQITEFENEHKLTHHKNLTQDDRSRVAENELDQNLGQGDELDANFLKKTEKELPSESSLMNVIKSEEENTLQAEKTNLSRIKLIENRDTLEGKITNLHHSDAELGHASKVKIGSEIQNGELQTEQEVSKRSMSSSIERRDSQNEKPGLQKMLDKMCRSRCFSDKSPFQKGHTRTFAMSGKAVRRLSSASPIVSMTIAKQKKALSMEEPDKPHQVNRLKIHGKGKNDQNSGSMDGNSDDEDNVFTPPSSLSTPDVDLSREQAARGASCDRGSLTYIVEGKDGIDMNNNADPDYKDIHVALITALSVSKISRDMSRKFLYDAVISRVGAVRGKELINIVKETVVECGQDYRTLKNQMKDEELELIPLLAQYCY